MVVVNIKDNSGFTLIEVLIVAVLMGVFAAMSTDTFTNIMRAQNKARVVSELEQSGNYALSVMEQQIREAEEVYCCGRGFSGSGCNPSGPGGIEVGVVTGGEKTLFQLWADDFDGVYVYFIRRCAVTVEPPSTICTPLTDTDPETGVSLDWEKTEITCDPYGTRVRIKLVLEPAPGSPARQDFRIKDAITMETTVVVRGSYE